eukprot:8324375-Ditylum_brightwellii.AAC.1
MVSMSSEFAYSFEPSGKPTIVMPLLSSSFLSMWRATERLALSSCVRLKVRRDLPMILVKYQWTSERRRKTEALSMKAITSDRPGSLPCFLLSCLWANWKLSSMRTMPSTKDAKTVLRGHPWANPSC